MTQSLLEAVENLSRNHREHEQFYAQQPREQAVALQRHARALGALADRWDAAGPEPVDALNPYEGADDLNAAVALQLDGILFMAGESVPAEIAAIEADLRAAAERAQGTGEWLSRAMEGTWAGAPALLAYPELSDLLGDRHRIIANDWQAASMSVLVGHILARAAELLGSLDLSPVAVRADLATDRRVPALLHSIVELVAHAADLLSDSAGLVHDNERRWRVFHRRVAELLAAGTR